MDWISFFNMVDLIDTVAGLILIGVFLILRGRKTTEGTLRNNTDEKK